jgi:hypothetical protein
MDYEALLRRAGGGDVRAFVELTRRFQQFAFGSAVALVQDFQQAEDVVQDAFVAAWSALAFSRGAAPARGREAFPMDLAPVKPAVTGALLLRELADARQEVRNLVVMGMRPDVSEEEREVIRNLERSARAKVKLSFKALAYHREQRATGHRD